MTIQGQNPVTSPTAMTNQAASAGTPVTSRPAATPSIDGLATENTFLQLLVAQIKNQDPTNPTDSVQFLTQLAQFSQLEQLIGIRQELQPGAAAASSTDPNSGTSGTAGTKGTTN
jgi:flagellar basal-body rod modification protein FlgD